MNYKIINKEQFPLIEATLNAGEQIKLETGSMVYKSTGINLVGKTNGGVFKAFSKSFLGGENFFTTIAESNIDNQLIAIAPRGFGDIYHLQLDGQTNWYLEDGVFLASSGSVEYQLNRNKGLGNALFGGTGGFFILKTSGQGDLFVEAFGSIIEKELNNEELIIDNSHLIAWEDTINHTIELASGTFGFKTGEGLVTRLQGTGKVLLQTRQPEALAAKIIPYVPRQR